MKTVGTGVMSSRGVRDGLGRRVYGLLVLLLLQIFTGGLYSSASESDAESGDESLISFAVDKVLRT